MMNFSYIFYNLYFSFQQGDRLDYNDLMVTDVDSTASNTFTVMILDDIHNALDFTYDTMPIEHPNHPDKPASTAIFTSWLNITEFYLLFLFYTLYLSN